MSREVMRDFDGGHGLTEQQQATLGIILPDPDGNGAWCYGQFYENGTYDVGVAVRHASLGNLISNSGAGEVTTDAAIGTRILEDTGEFDGDDFVGAIGYIYEGGGEGQRFWITKMLNDDKVQIALLNGASGRTGELGWETALTTASKYNLRLPGRFYLGDAISEELAGCIQTKVVVTDDYKPFGWVKCKGRGVGRVDISGTTTAAGGLLSIATHDGTTGVGNIMGAGGTVARAIGRAPFADALSADGTLEMIMDFPDWGPSFRRHNVGHSHNRVDY